jgi:3-deoxy-manno-octulosonate cytidylyltransferase (CMP-KDO synthetase)
MREHIPAMPSPAFLGGSGFAKRGGVGYTMLFPKQRPPQVTALIVIPARYASSRFPAKPLARETGKYLIQHVVEQSQRVELASQVVVATDDQRIFDAVKSFGGVPVMTSEKHQSGTDRIAEVIQKPDYAGAEIIVNVQGDEPEIEPGLVNDLFGVLQGNAGVDVATAATHFTDMRDVGNPNMVKVVMDARGFALYFSRSVIPHNRDGNPTPLPPPYRKHLGLYAYRRPALLTLANSPPCEIEQLEKLEQLRALYLGMKIHVTMTTHGPHGIDTPEDYAAFIGRYNKSATRTNSATH